MCLRTATTVFAPYCKTNNGEIRFIYDSNGNIVTTYHYDAWGTPLTPIGTLADTVGAVNPFRYKSYYYDSETRLYYLQSRYYDPQVGRFLNADAVDFLGVTGTLLSYNLFAYCENDPTNCIDLFGAAKIPLKKYKDTWWLLNLLVKYIPNVYTNEIITHTLFNSRYLGIGIKITLGAGLQTNARALIGRLFSTSAMELSFTIASKGWVTIFLAMGVDWHNTYLKFGVLFSPFNSIIFGAMTIELSVSHWTMMCVAAACVALPHLGTAVTSISMAVKTASIIIAKQLVRLTPYLVAALI